ncbi:PREDICTED: C2 calcium-dependent domain-containing protein 4C-like [Thamnophis sirtalis]|uniref:C2 calcium-dependent domain-containing protein 4C-like n=1 Tax=Thamnophis sirtalis TaxID=35019 RepID=A0A6I9XE88_9SAUR|nr:PREDICTED: C2 calcium-dependent domain-containing protein 4C-like [Thamnophis sirtalis]
MWFLEKMRASPGEAGLLSPWFLALPSEKGQAAALAFPNILTPDRIPEFCIPPRLSSPPPPKSPGPAFQPRRSLTEPGLQEAASPGLGPFPPHLIQVESVEELQESEQGGTNSDPQSQAALSLPHVPRTQTSYGFCVLLESPHTRRKESIFHSEEGSGSSLALPRSRSSSYGGREMASSPVTIRRHLFSRQGAWDSDTASSSESSPFGSPLLGRSPTRPSCLLKARSQERLLGKPWRGRRLSGITRAGSLSLDEGSSTDSSPVSPRRSSESPLPPLASSLLPLPAFPLDYPCGPERLGREATVVMDKGGLLRLSCEHCSANQRLRIRLISVEGLYREVEPKSINCCITFSLLPGKVQKQRSTVIKRSRNPIFNEDFFFVGVSEDHLWRLSVRMKALNKGGNMKRDLVLGESEVPLMQILAT